MEDKMVELSEAKNWSVQRLQFEINTLEREIDKCREELRDLEDYEDDGRGAPVGIEVNYRRIANHEETIEKLRNIIRAKL